MRVSTTRPNSSPGLAPGPRAGDAPARTGSGIVCNGLEASAQPRMAVPLRNEIIFRLLRRAKAQPRFVGEGAHCYERRLTRRLIEKKKAVLRGAERPWN